MGLLIHEISVRHDCSPLLGALRAGKHYIWDYYYMVPEALDGGTPPGQEMLVTRLPAIRFGLNRYGFQYFFTPDRSSMVSGSIH